MVVRTQTEEVRRLRRTNLELIFSDHNAYCLPPCQNKCPSHIDIPGFLKANAEGKFRESARIFKRTIPFPSILGRVCPAPCEEHCRRDEVDEAIAIRDSHRYAGDVVLKAQAEGVEPPLPFEAQPRTGKTVAIVGSGPAGMAAAYYLQLSGHDTTVFERNAEPGGMLRYGIPEYRLPKKEVLEPEYEAVWRLGAKLECNQALGVDFSLDDLHERGFDATIVATGCYDTNKLGVENENAVGVIDGLEYLRIATLGLPYPGHAGSRVVVIGGGFTAMDCTRTSVRQGAREITLVYRRDMKDMPAASEVHEAIEEGAKAIFQAGPTRGPRRRPSNQRQGRRVHPHAYPARPTPRAAAAPSPLPGTEFVIKCDRVLLAIGQGPDLSWVGGGQRRASSRTETHGSRPTPSPSRPAPPAVFGTGDVRIGAATVVQAIAEGRRCAYAVDAFLRGDRPLRAARPAKRWPKPDLKVPVDHALHRRGQGTPPPPQGDAGGGAQQEPTLEYEIPYSPDRGHGRVKSRCLQCTCEAMLELYQAYADYNIMMDLTEELISVLVEKYCKDNKTMLGEKALILRGRGSGRNPRSF